MKTKEILDIKAKQSIIKTIRNLDETITNISYLASLNYTQLEQIRDNLLIEYNKLATIRATAKKRSAMVKANVRNKYKTKNNGISL